MSANYASSLSENKYKGICGTKEFFDGERKLKKNVDKLTEWIQKSKHCVVYCGAGISTAAGIPDFRGPNGIWTLEKRGIKPDESKWKSFDQCQPTYTHLALVKMLELGWIKYIVSQNIDGLFLKSNIERKFLSELHGNYFIDKCNHCQHSFIRNRPSKTIGCKLTGDKCSLCGGNLCDTILDWEQELPEDEFFIAEENSKKCDLAICLGTSLQMQPANLLPLMVFDHKDNDSTEDLNKLVIINLQRTKFNHKASLVIHHYIDHVMEMICKNLKIDNLLYNESLDLTKSMKNDLIPWNR